MHGHPSEDPSDNGQSIVVPDITREEWERNLSGPDMERFLECLDLTYMEALECDLFGLLDKRGRGCITAEECVVGCIRLAGTAKTFDLFAYRGRF